MEFDNIGISLRKCKQRDCGKEERISSKVEKNSLHENFCETLKWKLSFETVRKKRITDIL